MPSGLPGSRVSRETRLLLLTVLLSVVALLVLARVRFPERPATPALVPPLLTQLAPATPFEDMTKAVAALEAQVTPSLQLLTVRSASSRLPRAIPALRLSANAAVALLGVSGGNPDEGEVIARDRATGLAVVRTPPSPAPQRPVWTPQQAAYPKYLLVTEAAATGVSLRPVFVGTLRTVESYSWETGVWIVPHHLHLPGGAFVFTTTGSFAGLVVDEPESQAVVPSEAVMAGAERLLTIEQPAPGTIGVSVQDLTPPIAAAVGRSSGVIVAQVDATGPVAGRVVPTDVIETLNGRPVTNRFEWEARLARLAAGERLSLRVRRGGQTIDVELTAAGPSLTSAQPGLGLSLRSRPGLGAEVTLVRAGSAGDRAGIRVGDILTRAGDVASPGPSQVSTAYAALAPGGTLLVAVTRGPEHLVVALSRS